MTPVWIEVCAAVVLRDGSLLLATRKPGGHLAGKWEFPGGKLRSGEGLDACIRRELAEELSLAVDSAVELFQLPFEYPEKCVRLHFMLCRIADGIEAQPMEGQKCAWFLPSEVQNLDLAPADALALKTMKDTALAQENSSLGSVDCTDLMAFMRRTEMKS